MRRTGESYTAARRHFLSSKDLHMTHPSNDRKNPAELPIEQLQLTLETTRALKAQGIHQVQHLLDARARDGDLPGLDQQRLVEVRDVLASRGF